MKVAITGKGGVGKTTLASTLAHVSTPTKGAPSSQPTSTRMPIWAWRWA